MTGTAIITLMVQSALRSRPSGEIGDVANELPLLIDTLDAELLPSVREWVRDFGVMKVIGFAPGQIAAS